MSQAMKVTFICEGLKQMSWDATHSLHLASFFDACSRVICWLFWSFSDWEFLARFLSFVEDWHSSIFLDLGCFGPFIAYFLVSFYVEVVIVAVDAFCWGHLAWLGLVIGVSFIDSENGSWGLVLASVSWLLPSLRVLCHLSSMLKVGS